jgi:hypothetical protein
MPHQWKRRQALSELDTNVPAKIAKTSEQKFNPALPTSNRNGPRAPRAENEIHADPSYSGYEGSDEDDDDIGGIDVDDIFSINEDAAAQSFERTLLRELRALGEPCTMMAQICTSDRHAADQLRLHTLRNITKRVFRKLDVPPLEWLHKSQNFLFEWSASKGVASARIEEARGLQAPALIWRRRTPLLERLLHSLLEGELFTLSRKDILNHVAIGRQNSLDGIYTRLGVGEADSGGFLEGETVTSLKGEIFFPSFIYIGESKDMVFRCTTHDMDRHSRRIVSGSRAHTGPSSFYFILQFRRSREGQAIQARLEYRVAIQRGVLQTLGRTVGDSIRVHLDFWDHEDPASYRALIANESDACEEWHAIGLPVRLRDDLSRIRCLFRD